MYTFEDVYHRIVYGSGRWKPLRKPHWGNRKTAVDIQHCAWNAAVRSSQYQTYAVRRTQSNADIPEDIIDRQK